MPIECKCNPLAHGPIVSTDKAMIRTVRKNSLEQANHARANEADRDLIVCCEWTAYKCLLRLRELKGKAR